MLSEDKFVAGIICQEIKNRNVLKNAEIYYQRDFKNNPFIVCDLWLRLSSWWLAVNKYRSYNEECFFF